MIQQEQSEIYRNKNYVRVPHQILQEKMRWKAPAEIYTMHPFAQLLESIIENWGKKDHGQNNPAL